MNPLAILALISELYENYSKAMQRAEQAERKLAELESQRAAAGPKATRTRAASK